MDKNKEIHVAGQPNIMQTWNLLLVVLLFLYLIRLCYLQPNIGFRQQKCNKEL